MIETGEKKNKYMKTLAILVTLIIFSTTNVFSKENIDCKTLKKTSAKYLICKTKAAGTTIKNNLSKKKQTQNNSGKKCAVYRFPLHR